VTADRNRTCIVTGSSSGIGWAVAADLAGAGWAVTGLSRRDVSPPGTSNVVGDAADIADLERAIGAAAPEGRLDGLVCAAGVPPSGPWDDAAHWAETIRVDLTGAYEAARLAWDALKAARGSVVLVGSIVGAREGSARSPAYSAAKAGLEGLARSLAVIGGPVGIRVNVVAPGAIDTGFDPPAFAPDSRPDVPLGRMGVAEEIAPIVRFLLSPDAAYVTGAVWTADGGRTALSPAAAGHRARV
jgi:NAD(P)-dependent dehydrogenase (short-subunit alcohol dehydrogenase family)